MSAHDQVMSHRTQVVALPVLARRRKGFTGILTGPTVQKAVAFFSDLGAVTLSHAVALWILMRVLHVGMDAQSRFHHHRYYIPYFALMLSLIAGYKSLELGRPEQELERSCKVVAASFLGLVLLDFTMFKSEPISFYLTVIWFILATVFLVTGRFTLRGVYGMLWKLGLCRKRVLLVGSASGTLEYLRLLRTQRHSGYEHAGVLLDSRSLQSHSEELLGLPVLGSISDCESRLKELKPELLIVTWAPGDEQWLHNLIQGCKRLPVDVELYSHVLATANLAHEPDEFSGCFRFYARSEWPMLVQRVLKRGMDIVIGFVGSVVTVILVPMIYVVANLEKRGPLFYRSAYLGQDGSIHYYLKFRTMEIDADRILQADPVLRARFQEHQKLVDDPRVTKVGRILRKFSLDEFPQFFSVLKGDLAFVGPRTIRKEEAGRYGARLTRLMSVKPGVTGLWQVMGRQTTTYEERVEMDMFYVDRWSIWLDLVIMAKTFWKVLKTEGAY